MPNDPSNASNPPSRFEEVLADLLQAEERGEALDMSQVLRTSPELERPLREFFRNRDGFDRLAPRLAPTAAYHEVLTSQAELPLGSRFGSYEVLQEVGHGGRGIVYRVSDPELNRPLAVKVLRPELRDEPDAVRRFLEEAQVTGQLQHPGIVPVHAIGQLPDGRPYFAMKLVQGRTLAELLAERPTPAHDLPRFLGIFEQMCQAVAYAHSRGVIHRDLKPANVMVGAFAEVQVMDWGLAKVLTADVASREPPRSEPRASAPGCLDTIRTVRTEATGLSSADGMVVGTIPYMSPEQAKGQVEQVDARADVFGLGAVLCEVLTGQPPYTGAAAWKLHLMAAAADLADAFARLDRCGVNAELIALAKNCLDPERERRPRDAGAVAVRLATYLAGVQERLRRAELEKAAARARAEEARATVRVERRARRLTVGLAATVLAVVVSLAVGGLWLQRQRAALRQEVGTALAQAARFRQGGHFEEGRELLEQVRQRLGTDGPTDLLAQVNQALADTKLTERLDAARQRALTFVEGGKLDLGGTEQEYAAALREAGLGQEGEDAEKVAARVRASAVRAEVVAALDAWAGIAEDGRRGWLLAVARAADPDPERDRLRQLGLWQDAAALARLAAKARVAELSPQLAAVLGQMLIASGNSVSLLREAQAHHPNDFWLNLELGMALDRAKQLDEAIGYYRAALALRPRANVVHINLGAALEHKGRREEAIGHYEEALRLDPKFATVHYNLGVALSAQGKLDEAVGHYEEALRIDPKYASPHVNLGVALEHKGRRDEAIGHYEEALRLDPKLATVHYNLGVALSAQGKLDEAVGHYEEALRIDPKNAIAHNNLGNALYDKNRRDEAVGHYQQALQIDPKYVPAHNNLGNALRAKGKLDEAVGHYEQALGLDPKLAETHVNLGVALYAKDKRDAAVGHWEQALRLDPKNAQAHDNLGLALKDKGRLDEAIGHWEQALRLDPKHAQAHNNLGVALKVKGKLEEAIRHYEKAIRIDPKYAPAHVNLGNALCTLRRLDEAVSHYEEALRIAPKVAFVHYNLGNALYDKGRLDEAVGHYEAALHIDPKNAQTRGALGQALLALGRWAEARDATRRCLDRLPLRHPLRATMMQQLQRCEEALRERARETK